MATLITQLEQLESAQLVRRAPDEDASYLFKHVLTQDTAYESLLLKKRRELHRQVAQAYEQLYADRLGEYAAVLAYQFAQAGDDAKTMEYSLQAAEAAVRLFAYPEARGHLIRALDALQRLPDTQEHRRHRVDAIFWYVEVAWGAFVPDELFGLVSEAEALANSLQNPDGTTGDPRRLAQIHTRLTGLHLARGEYQEAIRYAQQGHAEASGLADSILIATPAAQLGLALVAQGYFADAVPYLVQAITLSEETSDRWEWFGALGGLGTSHAMGGQVEEGLAEVQRALVRMEASQNGFGITQTRAFLLMACLEQEDMTRLLVESERTVEVAAKSEMALHASFALGCKALAQSRLGQPQDALESMAAARAMGARVGGHLMGFDWLAAANAEIVDNTGKLEDAIRVAEQAVALAQSCDGIFAEGWAQRVWGQASAKVGGGRQKDEVDGHLARSLELFERGGAVIEAARTHVAWGKAMAQRGNVDAAREHLEKAATQFQVSGLTSELEQTKQLIDSLPI
jgi:tetratricopeptide (TPR) repeat protein